MGWGSPVRMAIAQATSAILTLMYRPVTEGAL
jgi:hypothetical protein